ncbi:MAG: TlyA family RNA methyltransferase [Planctomycetes bacterium]|nr:TlyA family RNA methyltransferase [Planctomycetota bacterium]
MSEPERLPFASRGGLKLRAALDAFGVDPAGLICADLGSHAGGFVDCLLRGGAARVYAVDTGYGVLDHRLRRDARVVVCDRQNALAYVCPERCDLITIDVGWTPQRLILPAARRSLRDESGRIITLVKPHYEAPKNQLRGGVLREDRLDEVLELVRGDVADAGWEIVSEVRSPITGHGGNVERLMLLAPAGR